MREPTAIELKEIREETGLGQDHAKRVFKQNQAIDMLNGRFWWMNLRQILMYLVKRGL